MDKLRNNCHKYLSLVSEVSERITGHILFTPAVIESKNTKMQGMGLAPMAVLPEYQKQGIGSALVREGLKRLEQTRCLFVIVLGHSAYYPKFGFKKACSYGIKSEWDVPDEVFMIIVFDKAQLQGISGVAKYRSEFAEAM